MNIASPEDLTLINRLIDQGLVEKSTLIAMLEDQKSAYERQEQQLLGTLFLVDPAQQSLRIEELGSGKLLARRDLPQAARHPEDWEKWGSHLALLNASGSSHQASLDWDPLAPYGLVLSDEGVYQYDPAGLKADWIGGTNSLIYGAVSRNPVEQGPYDLLLSPDHSLLALCNRGEGSVEVISTRSFATRLKVKLRPGGGSAALNLAFDMARERLLITDQSSTQIAIIDLRSGELSQRKLGVGVLGNLVMAPDGEHVYVLSLKPGHELVYLRCADLSVVKSLLLKGDLYRNQGHDPCDLLAISPDGHHLVVMTYQHSPEPFSPLLSVVDTRQVKTVRRYSLKDGHKPCRLLFGRPNPLKNWQERDVREMIVTAGLVDAGTLEALMQGRPLSAPSDRSVPLADEPAARLMPGPVAPVSSPVSPGSGPEPVMLAEEFYAPVPYGIAPPSFATPEPFEHPDPKPVLAPAARPEISPAGPISLDAHDEAVLTRMLSEAFALRTGIDPESRPAALALLRQEAARLLDELARSESAAVDLERVAEGHGLRLQIHRRQLQLRRELDAWLTDHGHVVVPLECPECQQKLMGQWECAVCGFELESPRRAFAHRVASAEPITGLGIGHALLPDPLGPRLLELNARKEVVWHLDPDQLSCERPVDLIRLPQGHFLVADRDRNQIYEIGSRGKIHWSFQTFASDRHRLNQPVRVGYHGQGSDLRYLIVDQGHHRVLEVDQEHHIHWEFGVQGEAGSDARHLDRPTDLQLTPERTWLISDAGNGRVLEVEYSGAISQCFDASSYGLIKPVLARRLPSGHTLIVDAGAFQVLELDAAGIVADRISYYKPGMPTEMRLVDPRGLIRLPNQDLILFNERRALQILPRQKKLLWSASLQELKAGAQEPMPAPAPPPAPQQPIPAPIQPPASMEPLDKQGLTESLTQSLKQSLKPGAEVRQAGRTLRDAGDKSRIRPMSPEERVQALINKRTAPIASDNKESFEHSVIYMRKDLALPPLSLYLLDWRHNAVLRINRKGKITWQYGFEMGQQLAKPAFVQECDHSLIVTDADHHRILEINKADREIRNVLTGPPESPLANPRSALRLPDGHTLIADQRNKRLIELDAGGAKVWEFWHESLIASPQYVEALPDGDLLFADSLTNRVTQIDRSGKVKWYYGAPLPARGHSASLFGPSYATRLANGNTLIADTRNHRVLEVSPEGATIWEYVGHARNSRINPTYARRLENGNTLISYFNNSKVIELNPQNQCVWSYTIGKDVFLPPVDGDDETLVRHESEKPTSFYNAVEKRMIQTARQKRQEVAELHIELMDNVQMKSVRAQVIMYEVERYGMVFKSFPPPEDLLADRYGKHLIITCMLEGAISGAALGGRVANIAEVLKVEVREPRAV